MIILYSQSQVDGKTDATNWLDQQIAVVKHRRTHTTDFASPSKTLLEKEVKAWAAKAGFDMETLTKAEREKIGWGFKHYVPYQRIFNALQDLMLGHTRREIAAALTKCVVGMNLMVPDYLTKLGDMTKSELAFDEWLDWTIASVCYWPGIMCGELILLPQSLINTIR